MPIMKIAIGAAFLAFAATTLAQDDVTRFRLIAASANADLHNKEVAASGGQLWIDRATASYCPEQIGAACPAGNVTSFAGGSGTLGMNVMVPGGQQVYVNSTGSIKYTQAHSAFMDPGSSTTDFEYLPNVMDGYGQLTFNGQHGFLACSLASGDGHDIKVFTDEAVPDGCFQVDLLVPETDPITVITAWQYT